MMLARALTLIALLMSVTACQTENSSASDAGRYGGDSSGSANFVAAKAVITANCTTGGCHSNFAALSSEADWLASSFVVAGNAESSQVYYRIIGSAGAGGPKNMPQGGSLGAADLETIRNWVANASN